MNIQHTFLILALSTAFLSINTNAQGQNVHIISSNSIYYITAATFTPALAPGDIIRISSTRTAAIKFQLIQGTQDKPITIINDGGQVVLSTTGWGPMTFENCSHIRVTGSGVDGIRYGFKLTGAQCGLAFSELSTDCFAERVEIAGTGTTFFGIFAKKDYGGNPPIPYPQFERLVIRDCYIHDVSEGIYMGETVSPGMEFRHVRIYNNVISNTLRESIQIANAVEDIGIYNNVLLNAGLEGFLYQDNHVQIGGNSIVDCYNNVVSGAPGYGFIVLGMGNIDIHHNYSSSNLGNFIDDRYTPIPNSPIKFRDNFFRNITGTRVVNNMNQVNLMYFTNNQYDSPDVFLANTGGVPPLLEVTGNVQTAVPEFLYTLTNGVFSAGEGNPASYSSLGPIAGLSHSFVYPPPPVERIPVFPAMITDLVAGRSLVSPKYLCDEQSKDPDLNQHPVSISWKPAKNLKKAPYHIYFDLGSEYFIDRIWLHNMAAAGPIVVSTGTPTQWTQLFSDPAKVKNSWLKHSAQVKTRYIRLSITTNIKVMINEIAVYGYKTLSAPAVASQTKTEVTDTNEALPTPVTVYPNPATSQITIQAGDLQKGWNFSLYSSQGQLVKSGTFSGQCVVSVDTYPDGIYFIRIQDPQGKLTNQRIIIQ